MKVIFENDFFAVQFDEKRSEVKLEVSGECIDFFENENGLVFYFKILDILEFLKEPEILVFNDGEYFKYEVFSFPKDKWGENYLEHIRMINSMGSREEKVFSYLCLLNLISYKESSYAMLLTNLFFRISEDLEKYLCYFDFILDKKENHILHSDLDSLEGVRWYFSSSLNIGMLCMFNNEVEKAKEIFFDLYGKSNYISSVPLVLWNYCNAMLCLALILIYKGEESKSIDYLNEVFSRSRLAINELFHPKNEALLSQFHDCEMVLKLTEQAMIVQVIYFNQSKKMSLYKQAKYKLGKSQKFSSKPILKRYRFVKGEYLRFFTDIENKINSNL